MQPDVKDMARAQNVLAHEYWDIRYEIVWHVCRNLLPVLIRHLEELNTDTPPPDQV